MKKICLASSRQLSQTLWRSTASGANLSVHHQKVRYIHDDSTTPAGNRSFSPLAAGNGTSHQDPDASPSVAKVQTDLGTSNEYDRAVRSEIPTRLTRDVLREASINMAVPEHTRMVAKQLLDSPESSSHILNECVLRGDILPYETIQICLRNAYQIHRDCPEEVQKPIALPILKYVFKDSRRWLPLVSDRNVFPRVYLCFLAIVEGLEQSVRDWILTEVAEDRIWQKLGDKMWNNSDRPRPAHFWRGTLFQALVHSHLIINSGEADNAIHCFLDVTKRQRDLRLAAGIRGDRSQLSTDERRQGNCFFRAWPAAHIIIKQFSTGALHSTDALVYSRFENFVGRFRASQEQKSEWAGAVLALHRPQEPDERKAVGLLRKLLTQRESVSSLPQLLLENGMLEATKKAHEVALQNGNLKNAEWLLSTFEQVFNARTAKGPLPVQPIIRMCPSRD